MTTLKQENRGKVIDAIKNAVAKLDGVELVEVKFYAEYGDLTVEALLWRAGGVDLNLCEQAHGYISDDLDSLDSLFDGGYVLKVSSMGLDRPIVTDDDFRRALGTEIEFSDAEGKKRHGILKSYDAETATISAQKGDKSFDRKYITKVQPYIRF